jgi:hypothetical protein
MTDANLNLTDGHIVVGNGSGVAADVAMSGDATIDDTGAVTISIGIDKLTDCQTNYTYGSMALGENAAVGSSNASHNTVVGYDANKNNTGGGYNTYVGFAAGEATTGGLYNVAIGAFALPNATNASRNVCIGPSAGNNTDADYNVFIG